MRLSFDDEESFKEAVESLRFNIPLCDPDSGTSQRVGGTSSSNMPPQDSERDEDNITPNILRRVESSSTILTQERSEDIQIIVNTMH